MMSELATQLEKRALNFLVNEYLLSHGYKLTSVTFSNENVDFQRWDDVGSNTSKPPDLLRLYRDYMQLASVSKHSGEGATCHTCTSTDETLKEPRDLKKDEINSIKLDLKQQNSTISDKTQETQDGLNASKRSSAKEEIDSEDLQPVQAPCKRQRLSVSDTEWESGYIQADNTLSPKLKRRNSRREYKRKEQIQILNCIIEKDAYNILKGVRFWKDLEKADVIKGRTWQSLKEHFLKKVYPSIHLYNLTKAEKQKFRAGMTR